MSHPTRSYGRKQNRSTNALIETYTYTTMKKTIISKNLLSKVAGSSTILDVRNEEDVSNAKPYDKVPNSVFLKFNKAAGKIVDGEISKKLPADKSKSVIVHCYRGNRAGVVAEALKNDGYTNVANGKNVAYILSAVRQDGNVLVRQLFEKESSTYTYLLMDRTTREAVLIDPVIETVERDIQVLNNLEAKLLYVLNTHVHADHITGSGKLKKLLNEQLDSDVKVQSVISKSSGAAADIHVNHDETIIFGEQTLTVKSTPGHTPGCVTYILNDKTHAFCGDAVLIGGCGRTDFQGGDPSTLYDSVWNEILSLPDETVLYPAHDYKGRTSSTVGEEKTYNERLTKTKEDFIALMLKRFDGSNYPKKLDASLPANMKCGVY